MMNHIHSPTFTHLRPPHAREAAIAEWNPAAPWSSDRSGSEGDSRRLSATGAALIILFQLLLLWMLAHPL